MLGLFRRSELIVLGYFAYAAVVAVARPVDRSITLVTLWLNLTLVTVYVFAAWVDSLRRRKTLSVMRDWAPLALMLLAYREMGWFALPHASTSLEEAWVVWDRVVLNDWGGRAAIEGMGRLAPEILEVSYALVYAIAPYSVAALYLTGHRDRVDQFLFLLLGAVLGSYALFPYFPSEPPRTVFPTEDLPGVATAARQFNLWYLGNLGIHTSVFPSAHVSGAYAAAIGLLRLIPERRWIGAGMLVQATLIAISTVYGRYHYLVDALAGLGMALLAWRVTILVYRKQDA